MVHGAARVAEEHEVAREQLGAPHRRAVRRVDLVVGHARDLDARLRVGPLDEAGAVEARLRRRAAPLVRRARVLLRLLERGERLRPGAGRDGRRRGVGDGARRAGARAPAGAARGRGGRALEQLVGLVEPELVAAAELLGGAFDVGDPLAELAGVVDGLAARDALGLDALRRCRGTSRSASRGRRRSRGTCSPRRETRIWKKPIESASPKSTFSSPDSTSAAMTGSCGGMPRFSASPAIHAASCSLGASSPGYPAGAAGEVGAAAAASTPGRRARRPRGAGRCVGLDRRRQRGVRAAAFGLGGQAAGSRRRRTGRPRARCPAANDARLALGHAAPRSGGRCRGDRGRGGGGGGGAPAASSAGSLKSGVSSVLKPTWMWFWWAASVK